MAKINNVASIIRTFRESHPDSVALIQGERAVTWAQLDETSNRLANVLAAAGIGVGDRIARLEKNGLDYFEVLFAAAKLNAVLVDVNWRLAAPEVLQIVNDAGAKVLFVGDDFVAAVDQVEGDFTSVEKIVAIGTGSAARPTLAEYGSAGADTDPGVEANDDDVALQLYTSGTTGLPKGVMLSNTNLFFFVDVVPAKWGFDAKSVSHVVMPLFHIAGSGWSLVGLATGATTVVAREFEPSSVLAEIEARGVTHAIYVPAVLAFLQMVPDANDHDLSSMELIAYGASPITEGVLRGAMAQFATTKFVQVYGLTETTGAIVELAPEDHDPENRPELLRSAGKPYPWTEMRIVDGAGNDVQDGEVGEVWFRGPQIMLGYWNKPAETAAALDADGWLRTGDAGYAKDGYLFLHDRVKDMIVSGGENVYPAEVENAIMGCPGVADVAVIGVPDPKWGESVKAIIVPAAGAEVNPDEVIAFARERIAGFKVPKSVDFIDELPRNPSGKILKRELRAPYWEGQERQIG